MHLEVGYFRVQRFFKECRVLGEFTRRVESKDFETRPAGHLFDSSFKAHFLAKVFRSVLTWRIRSLS